MKASEVKKAIVLAAGLGTRLRPLTLVTPKPLLPVWDEPMLARVVGMLASWGVTEIAVNAHYLADKVDAWIGAHAADYAGVTFTVSCEDEILGTGGVLNPLRDFLGTDPFWLVNGDIVIQDLDPQPIVDAFEKSGRFVGCWMSERGPRTIEADPQGRICDWKSPDPGVPGTYTYCGCALIGPDIFRYVPEKGFSTVVAAYEKAMMEDGRFVIGANEPDSFWWDAGTIDTYREVNDGPQPAALYDDRRLEALIGGLEWKLDETGAEFLSARGSDRSFWRLVNGDEKAIAVFYDDAKRPENAHYASHTHLLEKAGVPVPEVLADLPAEKALALEDLGDDSLERRAKATGPHVTKLYAPVVASLARMHTAGTDAAVDAKLEPSFGPELFKWEHDLFEEHCVKGRYGFEAMPEDVRAELRTVAAELTRKRPVLVHRDFQCSNVLFRADGSHAFIDFQGMRLGPAAYDLASLLYDPYVEIDEKARRELASLYEKAAGYSVPELALAAVQRLVQALGAFGRLASVGKPEFGRHTMSALRNLLDAADDAGLDAIGGFAEELISKEMIRNGQFPHHHDHDHECGCEK